MGGWGGIEIAEGGTLLPKGLIRGKKKEEGKKKKGGERGKKGRTRDGRTGDFGR